jgi:hypothetical protein
LPTFSFEVDTNVPPEQMIAALTDFTENRLRLWPTIDKRYYKVLNLSETSADVEEGSAVSVVFMDASTMIGRRRDWYARLLRAPISPWMGEPGSIELALARTAAATSR